MIPRARGRRGCSSTVRASIKADTPRVRGGFARTALEQSEYPSDAPRARGGWHHLPSRHRQPALVLHAYGAGSFTLSVLIFDTSLVPHAHGAGTASAATLPVTSFDYPTRTGGGAENAVAALKAASLMPHTHGGGAWMQPPRAMTLPLIPRAREEGAPGSHLARPVITLIPRARGEGARLHRRFYLAALDTPRAWGRGCSGQRHNLLCTVIPRRAWWRSAQTPWRRCRREDAPRARGREQRNAACLAVGRQIPRARGIQPWNIAVNNPLIPRAHGAGPRAPFGTTGLSLIPPRAGAGFDAEKAQAVAQPLIPRANGAGSLRPAASCLSPSDTPRTWGGGARRCEQKTPPHSGAAARRLCVRDSDSAWTGARWRWTDRGSGDSWAGIPRWPTCRSRRAWRRP